MAQPEIQIDIQFTSDEARELAVELIAASGMGQKVGLRFEMDDDEVVFDVNPWEG